MRRFATPLFASIAVFAGGCAAHSTEQARGPKASEEIALCGTLGPLVDLNRAMASSPTGNGSSLFPLIDAEEELGYARAARERLSNVSAAHPIRASIENLVSILEERAATIAKATAAVRASYAATEAILGDASTCRGLDLREVAKQDDGSADVAVARSKDCQDTVRLWVATKSVDLSSDVSTAAVGGHVREMHFDKDVDRVRGKLAAALVSHSQNLAALKKFNNPNTYVTDGQEELIATRVRISDAIRDAYRSCLGRTPSGGGGRSGDPRDATVLVKPTWPPALRALGDTPRTFGSGFLVKWTASSGRAETVVVTNRHVMEGATTAEVLFASEVDARDRRSDDSVRPARLVLLDANDDIAVLRVDSGAAAMTRSALAFRAEPPREQEEVVAAGFPGVGAKPSFQVTKGIVSNAHFGAEARDLGVAVVQHTAAVDPGNSGGPLLDHDGRLLGMNTAKLNGRENVSLAIPAARIRFVLGRVDEPRRVDVAHAQASCNVVLEALAAEHPAIASIDRVGLSLYDASLKRSKAARRGHHSVSGAPDGPIESARLRGFEALRAEVDDAGGIVPYESCKNLTRATDRPNDVFVGTFATRKGNAFRVTLADEDGIVRLQAVTRSSQ